MDKSTQPERDASNPTTAMNLLSNARRAHIVTIVSIYDTLTLDELTTLVAEREQPESDDTEHIETALRHCHLPELTDTGVIEQNEDTITAGTHLKTLHNAYEAFCSEI